MNGFLMRAITQRVALFIFYCVLACLVIVPMGDATTLPNVIDYFEHISAIVQAKAALGEGQFPLRVAPLSHLGWQYPFFQFYSPSSYTMAGAIYRWIITGNALTVYKVTLLMSMVLGGLYLYRLALLLFANRKAAVLAGVVFVFSPYNLLLVNQLGAFNEVLGVNFFPVVLYYTLRFYQKSNSIFLFLMCSISWYLLITLHLITFIFCSLSTGLLLVGLSLQNPRQCLALLKVGCAFLFSCGMAAWFLGPIVLFENQLEVHRTFDAALNFFQYCPSLSYLLSPFASVSDGLLSGNGHVDNISRIHPIIGWVSLLGMGVNAYVWVTQRNTLHPIIGWLLLLFGMNFLLIWSPLPFWSWVPEKFMVLQYSWRLLGQLQWMGALFFASLVQWIWRDKIPLSSVMFLTLMIIVIQSSWWFVPIKKIEHASPKQFELLPTLLESEGDFEMYKMDVRKHPEWVALIDSILLVNGLPDEPIGLRALQLNVSHKLSTSFIKDAYNPFVQMVGAIPKELPFKQDELIALIDHKQVANMQIQTGYFTWKIPLAAFQPVGVGRTVDLQFVVRRAGKDIKPLYPIALKQITVEGFLKDETIIRVNTMETMCHQQGPLHQCDIDATQSKQWAQLPLLYYPSMLSIRLNDHKVPYYGVLKQNHLLTAIQLTEGHPNHIEFQFVGMLGPNFLSRICWYGAGLLLIYGFIKKMTVT